MNSDGSGYVNDYLQETIAIASQIDQQAIEALVEALERQRHNDWRVFVLGLGGSLANASHLAADLRVRTGVRATAPESLPELTAWANDIGWKYMFVHWLESRDLNEDDMVLALSVGGGGIPFPDTSEPLMQAIGHANDSGAVTALIVGAPGGLCGDAVDVVVKIPVFAPDRKTEHCEGWQGVLHHLLVSHPRLRRD